MSPRLPRYVVGVSLKMYLDGGRTRAWLGQVAAIGSLLDPATVELFVLPGFLAIRDARFLLAGSGVGYGAQDVCWADEGAYTGEVSAPMLADEGCRYAEVGHAERRRLFGETDEMTVAKAAAAARSGLVPVVCIGEPDTSASDAGGIDGAVAHCAPQVTSVLAALPPEAAVIFAYEPVWAIGAAEPAPPAHVIGVVDALRTVVDGHRVDRRGVDRGDIRFLYGGSAGPGTFEGLRGSLDGLFLGRFAHDPGNLQLVLDEVLGRKPAPSRSEGQS